MSVAFRRESDEEHLEPKFELPIPPGPNFVTPDRPRADRGPRRRARSRRSRPGGTRKRLKALKRDLRYWRQRQSSAQPAPRPRAGDGRDRLARRPSSCATSDRS